MVGAARAPAGAAPHRVLPRPDLDLILLQAAVAGAAPPVRPDPAPLRCRTVALGAKNGRPAQVDGVAHPYLAVAATDGVELGSGSLRRAPLLSVRTGGRRIAPPAGPVSLRLLFRRVPTPRVPRLPVAHHSRLGDQWCRQPPPARRVSRG